MIRGYLDFKNKKNHELPVTTRRNTRPARLFPLKKDIFSSTRVSKKEESRAVKQTQKPEYDILGLVKKDKLFAVIQFIKDKKIKLVPEGSKINARTVIDKIEPDKIVLRENNVVREVKIFKFSDLKYQVDTEIKNKEKKGNRRDRASE